ncbi:MAG: Fe-S cluster assembly ATPase SufC [Candidatus Actinomarinales bacterium]|nr:MAG: Fe-S cluster assembly ATPase SufC [Candidatus Actinomarinales bacterium]|tara:strand:- start:558 stop:1283 length:726 start_codon:yes stop_codon:yes gene_type:complete
MLKINNLHASVEGNEILSGINLDIKSGEVHAIMGPNGSGKSTLANVLMGNPVYEVTNGTVEYMGEDITDNPADKRAKKGMFMAFQYPESIPGVTIVTMLKAALSNITDTELTTVELRLKVADAMKGLGLEPDFVDRYLNEGFSGGERKRNEILQLAVLEPKLAILDETDSGLDVDGLKIVGEGVDQLRNKDRSFLIVTHYQRLLNYIKPDYVHVFIDGDIVETGTYELSQKLEQEGYDSYI